MMRRCLVVLALPLLSACGSISVTSESVPSFNPASQVWQVESSAGSNRHKFILTSVGGYCSKKKKAEQGISSGSQLVQETHEKITIKYSTSPRASRAAAPDKRMYK